MRASDIPTSCTLFHFFSLEDMYILAATTTVSTRNMPERLVLDMANPGNHLTLILWKLPWVTIFIDGGQ
jgi:hypothetical protein